MNLSEEITHCEQQLVKLEVQLAKEQATQLAMREKYAALEITVSEKAFYDSNRPTPMLEAGIEDLQKTMNGIGEYVQGKHMILQSFLASQTSRAKLQDNRMADLKHDISLAEATMVRVQDEVREQEATNRKTKQLHQQTQILIDKKLIVEANIEKHQIEFNQIAEHKRQLQNESNMLALDIDEAAKRASELEHKIADSNHQVQQLSQLASELEHEFKATHIYKLREVAKIKEIQKALAKESADIVQAKTKLCQRAIRTTEQYGVEAKLKSFLRDTLQVMQTDRIEMDGFQEAMSYFKMCYPALITPVKAISKYL